MDIKDFTEREQLIIRAAMEMMTLTLPGLAQNLVEQQISKSALKLVFLEKLLAEDARYKKWKTIIDSTVEKYEAQNPGDLKKALQEALPEIKRLVSVAEGLSLSTEMEKPTDRVYKGPLHNSEDIHGTL